MGRARLDGPVGARPCLGDGEGGRVEVWGGRLSHPNLPPGLQFPPIELPTASRGAPEQAGGTGTSPHPSQGRCSAPPGLPMPPQSELGALPAPSGPRGCSARRQRGAGTAPASSSSPARHRHLQIWVRTPTPRSPRAAKLHPGVPPRPPLPPLVPPEPAQPLGAPHELAAPSWESLSQYPPAKRSSWAPHSRRRWRTDPACRRAGTQPKAL